MQFNSRSCSNFACSKICQESADVFNRLFKAKGQRTVNDAHTDADSTCGNCLALYNIIVLYNKLN